jgi:hypothetical protein
MQVLGLRLQGLNTFSISIGSCFRTSSLNSLKVRSGTTQKCSGTSPSGPSNKPRLVRGVHWHAEYSWPARLVQSRLKCDRSDRSRLAGWTGDILLHASLDPKHPHSDLTSDSRLVCACVACQTRFNACSGPGRWMFTDVLRVSSP